MNGSSAIEMDLFKGLKWANVIILFSIIRKCEFRKIEYIKRQYSLQSSDFQKTLYFMSCLQAVREHEGDLCLLNNLDLLDENSARGWFFNQLFYFKNIFREKIFDYLIKFYISDGEILYRPPAETRHHFSWVRNFLMELGIIKYDNSFDYYQITAEHINLFTLAKENSSPQTNPKILIGLQRDKEIIGESAEKFILEYEKNRVGLKYKDIIEHVALHNASAGYDLKSITVNQNGKVEPRYIEVKAVPGYSFKFYWTSNEVRTAKHLNKWYYLYLLPVNPGGLFALDRLKIIPNPYDIVLHEKSDWIVEPDILKCRLKKDELVDFGVLNNEK